MTPQEWALVAILIGAFGLILTNRLPNEITALLVLLFLGFGGIVQGADLLSGFSSSVVITLIGLFAITKALEETGVINWMANRLSQMGGGSELRLTVLFMLAAAFLSMIMNNVAAGAVLLPAAVRVARMSKVRISKLLMPLSFGSMSGGMATYLTTANIVMSEILLNQGLEGLTMISFIPTGGIILFLCVLFMAFFGRRFIPDRESMSQSILQADLQETYQLEERLWEVQVYPQSRLAETPLSESGIGEQLGLTVLAVWHGRQAIFTPAPDQVIHAGDFLLILGRQERLEQLLNWGCELRLAKDGQRHKELAVDLVEVIIPPRSNAIGQTLRQLGFRNLFGVTATALWRGGRSYRTDVGKMPLQVGDALLVVGSPEKLEALAKNRNYIVPYLDTQGIPHRTDKAWLASLITVIVLTLAILNLAPLPLLMLAGAAAAIVTGCIRINEFYEAIEWRVIFLIAGMLPLSIALTETGLTSRIGEVFVNVIGPSGEFGLIIGVFLLAMLVTQVIGGQVTALVVGPLAVSVAVQLGLHPQAMAVATAIGCSTAYLTPIAHPVNILMMGPAGYRFGDFFKPGLGMSLVTLIGLAASLWLFWGVGR